MVVEVETFDGAYRSRIKGGGQYWAHQAEAKVSSLVEDSELASPQSMLGKAQRVKILCDRAIDLSLKGPHPTPRALTNAGIFFPPIARPGTSAALVPPVVPAEAPTGGQGTADD